MALQDDLRNRLRALTVWKRAEERAPHEPLLLLTALARIQRNSPRLVPFPCEAMALRHVVHYDPNMAGATIT